MDWSAWREEFPIFQESIYLNTCSLGPLSRRVRAAHIAFLDEWDASGAAAWPDRWLDALARLRGLFARVIGARSDEVAIAPSVSVALSSIASSLPYDERPKVVLSDLDFPTVGYQWAVKPGVQEVFVESVDGVSIPVERYDDAVDDRTAAVATSHVFYTSGAIQDIARIARVARRHGTISIIDAYHATGQLPTDVHEAGIDVLITGGLKWLLGGTGLALMYVQRDRIRALRPTITGWFGNLHQFDFDLRRFEFPPDARRFELGTPAMAAVYAATAGLGIILEIGVERLRARTSELVDDLFDRAADAGFTIKTPADSSSRAGIVMMEMKDAARAVRTLANDGIIVDSRHNRVRASPFFYNTPEDNEACVDALLGRSRARFRK